MKGRLQDVPYACARVGGRVVGVARAVAEEVYGPLGVRHAHHVCGNSLCVNPAHLQPVARSINQALSARNTNRKRREGYSGTRPRGD